MLKRVLIVVAVLVGVAAFVSVVLALEDRRLKSLTAIASGQVSRVVVQIDSETGDASTIVHYAYRVEDQILTDQSTKSDDVSDEFLQGAPVTVCYDPAKPAETEVYTPGATCPPR